jgi:putative ABC transport system permease protein
MGSFLALKEVWRGKGRFLLFSLVIALITVLVLFIAGLAEGLAAANKEYLEKVDGQLIVFQEDQDLSTIASRLGRNKISRIRGVEGVDAVGPVGLSSAKVVIPGTGEDLDVSLIGYVPGSPGGAPAFEGESLRRERTFETVIDKSVASQTNLGVGDVITLRAIQGEEEELFELQVVGITDGRQNFFAPSIFVPSTIWNRIRPQPTTGSFDQNTLYNIAVVKLDPGASADAVATRIENEVEGVEVVDPVTAYKSTPGYQAQQSTLNTQRGFTLLIGILVIGGFFQIQTLQKVPNIGMLKAIGASNMTVAASVLLQIVAVTVVGVAIGAAWTFLLSLGLPPVVPIRFTMTGIIAALGSLLLIGPLGGLVSVRSAIRVEPLIALGL